MSLSPGTRIGPYEITGPLGKGGMGEVYRARDSKLDREVAVKVLPHSLARDPERLARFEREAKVLASLNHPNIATIYSLEEAPEGKAIAMELVDGATLKSPLPLDEALRFASQIAEALEAAHDKGITHRDLKPANIMVTPAGLVKVLDFGLAAVARPAGGGGENSPTLTMGMTEAGVIMGTAAYMSPEQAVGNPVDRRADIWSFGVVLWQMLVGKALFSGDTTAHILANVINRDIDFGMLPESTPTPIRELLKRCLDRDVMTRLRDIGEARIAIQRYLANPESAAERAALAGSLPQGHSKKWMAATVVATLALLAVVAWAFYPRATPPGADPVRFTIDPPEGTRLALHLSADAVSPDGRSIAFLAEASGQRSIWVRPLASLAAQKLDHTEGAYDPFWSPDSQHIAFFADGKLKRIPVSGGSTLNVANASDGMGGTWALDPRGEGVIIFAPDAISPLQRVPAAGGVPTPVTTIANGAAGHAFPQFLPDGQRVLYVEYGRSSGTTDRQLYVQRPGSTERTLLIKDVGRFLAPPDVLFFLRDNTLLAQRFDWTALKPVGEPAAIADGIRNASVNGRNSFSVSANGVLAYRSGGSNDASLVWYMRDGKPAGVAVPSGVRSEISLSPDDTRVVLRRGGANATNLWLLELSTGVLSRLTSGSASDSQAVWSPDSRRIAFVRSGSAGSEVRETVIGSGKETLVYSDGVTNRLEDWTRDGKLLVRAGNTVSTITLPPEGSGKQAAKPELLLDAPWPKDEFRISPDGKWVAYVSQESGAPEINVAAFPSFTNRRQISTAGGVEPLWRGDSRELFFLDNMNDLIAVEVTAGTILETGPLRPLFRSSAIFNFATHQHAVTRNGQRFLNMEQQRGGTGVEPLYVITNWTSLIPK